MQERITVSDFYKKFTPSPVVTLSEIRQAFISDEALYVLSSSPTHISRYCLRCPERCTLVPLPQNPKTSARTLQTLHEFGNLVCYSFRGEESIWCFCDNNLFMVQAHFAPITALARLSTNLYSSSEDLTIRIWNSHNSKLVPNASKHAMTGHSGAINCLVGINTMLLSGSEDKSVAVWESNQLLAMKTFSSAIINLFFCEASNQVCVQQKEGAISIVDFQRLKRQKALIVSRQIEGLTLPVLVSISEIDDSFALAIGESSIQVVEVNLGTVVGDLNVDALGKMLAVRTIRRLILMAVQNRGLFLLKL